MISIFLSIFLFLFYFYFKFSVKNSNNSKLKTNKKPINNSSSKTKYILTGNLNFKIYQNIIKQLYDIVKIKLKKKEEDSKKLSQEEKKFPNKDLYDD